MESLLTKCIGYGIYEGKCSNQAGTPWTPFWCKRCDDIRRKTVRKQLVGISKDLKRRKMGHTKNSAVLKDFTTYCKEHTELFLDGRR